MSEEQEREKPYVGKYVVYNRMDGGACFGLIVDEGFVNTLNGEREVFLLDKRIVRYSRTGDVKRFRRFYPNATARCRAARSWRHGEWKASRLFARR
jgi:hypothetical protein